LEGPRNVISTTELTKLNQIWQVARDGIVCLAHIVLVLNASLDACLGQGIG